MITVKDIITASVRERRVCPMPQNWNRLWEMLPNRIRRGVGWEPAAPLILAAWDETSDAAKRERFHLHLRWAEQHGALNAVAAFLATLTAEQWLHDSEDPQFDS